MKKTLARLALVGATLLCSAKVQATPTLQLDISEGVYDGTTQTIKATSTSFTLYAILTKNGGQNLDALLADTYYISAALTPKITSGNDFDLGSFAFNGLNVSAKDDSMTYGSPPLHDLDGGLTDDGDLGDNGGDLAGHGIFDTYYTEFAFTFDRAKTVLPYNTQDHPGGFTAGEGAYYQEFTVDVANLDYPYAVHFDLYETMPEYEDFYTFEKTCVKWKGTGDTAECKAWKTTRVVTSHNLIDIDVNQFAPFSHDAESSSTPVPEPATMLLLGTGLVGIGALRRKNRRN